MTAPIYLDHAATTPLDERVFAAMEPYLRGEFGNAASSQHAWGQRTNAAVERARAHLAAALHADPREVVFCSGATEANNLALLGLSASPSYQGRRHIITVRTEHRAVLDPCRHLEQRGLEVTWLGVSRDGLLDLKQLSRALRADTLVVSVMHGNNETGVVQPLAEIAAMCREHNVLLHSDATQAFGKLPLHGNDGPHADLVSLSAHKLHGPQGIGALFVRRRNPRVRLAPLLHGGGHERGLRSGTLPVALIVGLGAAAALAHDDAQASSPTITALRDRLELGLTQAIQGARVNGAAALRLPHITNITLPGTDAGELMRALPNLAMATASACSSTTAQPSFVLGAMGVDPDEITASLRLSVGRTTTTDEVDRAIAVLQDSVRREQLRLAANPAPDHC